MKCKICGNQANNKTYAVREMMLGLRDEFVYYRCSECGCLQLDKVPDDMAKYYPRGYYSFQAPTVGLVNKMRLMRDKHILSGKSVAGKLISNFFPSEALEKLTRKNLLRKDCSILDVGCGNGLLLYSLKENGYEKVEGIDPYIDSDIVYDNGLKINKKTIHEITGKYDVIMFHHAFEHISDPVETFKSISEVLASDGICVIRIPISSSFAWEKYQENWVQLDAPRHLYLHTTDSINRLAKMFGLMVKEMIFDSTFFQFMGSEQYARGISLNDKRSYNSSITNFMLNFNKIRKYQRMAAELNLSQKGDQCAFILAKAS